MRQVIQNYKSGQLSVEKVPIAALKPGGVLVRNAFSVISVGTERTSVVLARKSLWGKARSRPEDFKKVLRLARNQGFVTAYKTAMSRLEIPLPLGYSSAGEVLEVAKDVKEFRVGDRVACAGGGYANHAEVVFVPKNLCALVPDQVPLDWAAFTTLGAIALQGVRQADVKIGEWVAVIGLGLVGQLTAQIVSASGCRVLGLDIDDWKLAVAKQSGIDSVFNVRSPHLTSHVLRLTNGYGADAVIITAATDSNEPFLVVPGIIRDRGRVVLVGVAKLDFPREPYYRKELSVVVSRSCGPGRYDPLYEEKGADYPIGYVRWTEKRNMEAFLQFLGSGRLALGPLITHRYKIDDAAQAYDLIIGKGESGKGVGKGLKGKCKEENYLGILLEYPMRGEVEKKIVLSKDSNLTPRPLARAPAIGVGFIGAGNFARSFLLPNLCKNRGISPVGVADADGIIAKTVAKKYRFRYCTSDYRELLADSSITTVFIATRHNLHARLIIESLQAGKNVFCEKPLCITESELNDVIKVHSALLATHSSPLLLMVGYNRRFAPLTQRVKDFFSACTAPYAITYRINAGFIPQEHWILDPDEGGGRIVGEVCHFVDFAQYLTQSPPVRVFAEAITDDTVHSTIKYNDGSIATIHYVASGDPMLPKERIEIFNGGLVAVVDDFKHALFYSNEKRKRVKLSSPDKGYGGEVRAFTAALREGTGSPIAFGEIVATSLTTFKIIESLQRGSVIEF